MFKSLIAVPNTFFLVCVELVTNRASQIGIPWDIYR